MLRELRLMAIMRDIEPRYAKDIVKVLLEEGIDGIEVSLSDPEKGMGCIKTILDQFGNNIVKLGAGTVTKTEEIKQLKSLGVTFILTPGYDDKIVSCALDAGIEVLPGVLSPSEVQQAVNRGIHLLKLFPADAFGLSYIKSLKGPFPQTDYMAVGGVNEDNIRAFFEAGFVGAAIGNSLIPRGATDNDLDSIRIKAAKYRELSK